MIPSTCVICGLPIASGQRHDACARSLGVWRRPDVAMPEPPRGPFPEMVIAIAIVVALLIAVIVLRDR